MAKTRILAGPRQTITRAEAELREKERDHNGNRYKYPEGSKLF